MLKEVHALAEVSTGASQGPEEGVQCIIRYFGSWIEDDHVCICTELCEHSLEDYIASASLFFSSSMAFRWVYKK